MKNRNWFISCLIITICLNCMSISYADVEEDSAKIYINDVQRQRYNNWLGVPNKFDCTLQWSIYTHDQGVWKLSPNVSMDYYKITRTLFEKQLEEIETVKVDTNYYKFVKIDIGKRFGFIIRGYSNEIEIAVSDTIWITTGIRAQTSTPKKFIWHHWIPFNGRIPLALIGRVRFFEEATKAGQIAFHLIWNFFLGGVVIWLFFCVTHLSLWKIFPMKKGFLIGKGYDEVYNNRISEIFKNEIIGKWKEIVENTNTNLRQKLVGGSKTKFSAINDINTEYWQEIGSKEVAKLKARIIELKFEKYPTGKIILAGLGSYELGGFNWFEVTKEVDRAIENFAASERERLKRKSLLDWLWNIGTLSPLIGLFGTATGISHAFSELTYIKLDVTQTELVKKLAGGIYEALWTTIEGLAIGVVMMLLYFYYQNKLNWIYSKWEEIYVNISKKL